MSAAPAPETRPADRTADARDFFESLLAFEDESLLEFRFAFDGMPIWPFARWETLLSAMTARLGLQPLAAPPARTTMRGKADYAWNVWRLRPTRGLGPFDVLWFGSAAGVVLKKEGRWFGRVNDYLVDLHPDGTLLIEDAFQRAVRLPRHVRNHRIHDFIRLRARLMPKRPSAADTRQVAAFIGRVRERLPHRLDGAFYAGLERRLLDLSASLPLYHSDYSRIFERTRPKVVLQEDGSYGMRSYILAWARRAGIRTAEMQHGAIIPTHHAYNYGPAGFHADYAPHLPEFLLTYGAFWTGNTRTPSAPVEIGNPHFSARLAESPAAGGRAPGRRLLLVSQADVTDRMVGLAKALSAQDGGLEITFRLHPAETTFEERYRALRDLPNVTISASGDIYGLIQASDWVAGVSSTTLYEAVGMDKPVFVLDCPSARLYTPSNFGAWFPDAAALLEGIRSGSRPGSAPKEDVWAPDWERAYRRFLARDIGLEPFRG